MTPLLRGLVRAFLLWNSDMNRIVSLGAAVAAALALAPSAAFAHGFAGKRFFPATIATEDPAAADELALPTIFHLDSETEYSAQYAKRITPHLAFSIEGAWTSTDEEPDGMQNIETGIKWQFHTNPDAESIMAAGVDVEWGGTGDSEAGAEDTTVLSPTFLFGKGFGGSSVEAMRPFAITGTLAYSLPAEGHDEGGEPLPNVLSGGFAIEYSLPYLAANVRDNGWPGWVNQLTPLVEVTFERPVRHGGGEGTTGTINPGVLWTGRRLQLGVEAIIPMNDESGDSVGWAFQAHFFVDDMLPHSLGRPIFGGS
jgi:hypothetical protein